MTKSGQDGTGNSLKGNAERRTSPHLRDIFEHACRLTESLFDAHEGMGGESSLRLFAHRRLHDAYPDLSLQDMALLVSGVTGYHLARLKKAAK
ncbi:MAG TPA: hypothetical protein VFR06_01645 [Gallionellaceae bacterium]|nr:hypothetical protein [Gallionellaceae bacterium]